MKRSNPQYLLFNGASVLLTFLLCFALASLGQASARASFANLHDFDGAPSEGSDPYGTLVYDPASGDYYGTTRTGGKYGLGTVYCMNPNFGVTIIHDFTGAAGENPTSTLFVAPSPSGTSELYGTTLSGGKFNLGVVFKLTTTGAGYSNIHAFSGAPDGSNPWAGVIIASDGFVYGATLNGGSAGYGTIYRLETNGAGYKVTHNFMNYDGARPFARLYEFKPGLLVGTTAFGGEAVTGAISNDGVVFFDPLPGPGYAVVHNFAGSPDGAHPMSELITVTLGGSSTLWGMTMGGGLAVADGTIYSLETSGSSYMVEYSFMGGASDGANPIGGLLQSSITSNIYGTTMNGGASGLGTVYEAVPGGAPPIPETAVYMLTFTDGWHPYAALCQSPTGSYLFSTTSQGGVFFDGTIFEQSP